MGFPSYYPHGMKPRFPSALYEYYFRILCIRQLQRKFYSKQYVMADALGWWQQRYPIKQEMHCEQRSNNSQSYNFFQFLGGYFHVPQ